MDATKDLPPGPYSLGGSEPVIIDGVECAPGIVMRENSGALVILAPDEGEDAGSDRRRIGTVDLIDHRPKRGEGWKTTAEDDPRQMALARLWMTAPDTLDALEKLEAAARTPVHLIGAASVLQDAADEARASIAKARGA